jgi:hypothetical protein
MHLVIPFAAPLSAEGQHALKATPLPHLQRRLRKMTRSAVASRVAPHGHPSSVRPELVEGQLRRTQARLRQAQPERDSLEGDELSFSAPHEQVLAQALGWTGADGRWPWAARQLAALGHAPGSQAWGLLTPAHWHLGTEQVSLTDPAALMLDEATSRALLDAVAPLFSSEGFTVVWGAPLAWFIAHESLADVPCASLDRVIGRNVDRWLPPAKEARLLRRLQNEVQMLLYTHPINSEREARGLLPVNSFWLSGCGVRQPDAGTAPRVDERLRSPALAGDWAAWSKAWSVIDDGLAALPIERLTLCGERSALSWQAAPRPWWQQLSTLWPTPAPALLMAEL